MKMTQQIWTFHNVPSKFLIVTKEGKRGSILIRIHFYMHLYDEVMQFFW